MANKEREEITKLIVAISDKWKEQSAKNKKGGWKKLGNDYFNEAWFEENRRKKGEDFASRQSGFDSSQITQWRNGKKIPQWAKNVFADIGCNLGFDEDLLKDDSFSSDKWREDLNKFNYFNDRIEKVISNLGISLSREFLFYFKKNFMDSYIPQLKLKKKLYDDKSMELYHRLSFHEDYEAVFETGSEDEKENELFEYVKDPYFLNRAAANSPYFYKDTDGKYYEFSDGDYEILAEIEDKVNDYIRSLLAEIQKRQYDDEEFFICSNMLREAANIDPKEFTEMLNDNSKIQIMYERVIELIIDQLNEIEILRKRTENNIFHDMETGITIDDIEKLILTSQGNTKLQVKGLASILSLTRIQLQYLRSKEKEEADNAEETKDRKDS